MRKNLLSLSLILFTGLIQAQTIYTFAGTGTAGFSGDGGAANAAKFFDNYGMCVDATGNVYVADTYNYRLRKINTTGIISTISGTNNPGYTGDGGPATAAKLDLPYSVTTDAAGNIYIGDWGNNVIRKINTSGIISTIAGGGATLGDGGPATLAKITNPFGLVADASGNVYIAEDFTGRIRKVNSSGIITTAVGTGTPGYSGDGGPANAAQIEAYNRNGLAVDAAGNLYISDNGNHRIRKVNTSGIITTIAGNGSPGFSGDGGLATAAQLKNPNGIAVDPSGNIYFADVGNSRIRKINTSGIISTIAGTGIQGALGDGGPALSAQLTFGYGIASDAAGNIYINDKANNKVRVICMGPCPYITGISSLVNENNFSIYPNPNNGSFKLQMNNEVSKSVLVLYNSIGQKVFEQKLVRGENPINTYDLAKGLYHYVISQDNEEPMVGKIVAE